MTTETQVGLAPVGRETVQDRVYAELLKSALEAGGCEVFHADGEQRAGDIRTDMFQEQLVADLTMDSPDA